MDLLRDIWYVLTHNDIVLFFWWLAIVLIAGVLASKLITRIRAILVKVYNLKDDGTTKWAVTLIRAVTWVIHVAIWIVIFVTVLTRVGVPSVLIAGLGTILGAAIGFGAQETVRDVLKGVVHLLERQFAVGDLVTFSLSGNEYIGVVKDISLRAVVVATENEGDVSIPQGYMSVIKNYSTPSSTLTKEYPFDIDVDAAYALEVLNTVVEDIETGEVKIDETYLTDNDKLCLRTMTNVQVRGISSIDKELMYIQIIADAAPSLFYATGRVINKLVTFYLCDAGISFAHKSHVEMEPSPELVAQQAEMLEGEAHAK